LDVQSVEKFDEEARVLKPKHADAEAALILWATDLVPSDKALGAGGPALANPPEERPAKGIKGGNDRGRELKRRHRMCW
jgi:hypothetical protein